jgi:hypothetical protein
MGKFTALLLIYKTAGRWLFLARVELGNRTAACAISSDLVSGHLACSVPVFE